MWGFMIGKGGTVIQYLLICRRPHDRLEASYGTGFTSRSAHTKTTNTSKSSTLAPTLVQTIPITATKRDVEFPSPRSAFGRGYSQNSQLISLPTKLDPSGIGPVCRSTDIQRFISPSAAVPWPQIMGSKSNSMDLVQHAWARASRPSASS
jgi:hypothetical protein